MRIVIGHDSAAIRTFTYVGVSPFPDDTLWRHCTELPLQQQCDPLPDRNQRPTKKEKHQWPHYKKNHLNVRQQFVVHRSSLANCQLVSSASQLPAVGALLSHNRAVSFCCGRCRRACRQGGTGVSNCNSDSCGLWNWFSFLVCRVERRGDIKQDNYRFENHTDPEDDPVRLVFGRRDCGLLSQEDG